MSNTDLFFDTASIDYPIVDSDAHVNEPPELWVDRVPSKWRDRAPRVVHSDGGDLWVFDGGKEKWPVGLTATAGWPEKFPSCPSNYEECHPGSYDASARLKYMDSIRCYAHAAC